MQQFTDEELMQIIAYGESDCVEFKQSLSGDASEKIREAICAFANDLPNYEKPGFVFIGVRDDKTIIGLSDADQVIEQLSHMKSDGHILPLPSMTVEKQTLENKEVVVIRVEPADSPPVRCKGVIRIRTGSRRDIATAQDERILTEKRRHKDIPFDLQPIPTSDLSDLNLIQFEHEYLAQAIDPDILAANERTIEERLAVTKMIASIDEPFATVMGILVLGKNPQDFLPGAYVQFLRIANIQLVDDNDILDSEEIRGTIPDLLHRLDDKLIAHNRTVVNFTSSPIEQRTELYPIPALQQIIRNAIMHRTYEGTNALVHVYWFSDRVEILSPGGVFGAITAKNFGQPHLIDYRNPNLAEAMRVLGYVQKFGSGIQIARNLLRKAGHPEPEFEVLDNFVRTTIKLAPK